MVDQKGLASSDLMVLKESIMNSSRILATLVLGRRRWMAVIKRKKGRGRNGTGSTDDGGVQSQGDGIILVSKWSLFYFPNG